MDNEITNFENEEKTKDIIKSSSEYVGNVHKSYDRESEHSIKLYSQYIDNNEYILKNNQDLTYEQQREIQADTLKAVQNVENFKNDTRHSRDNAFNKCINLAKCALVIIGAVKLGAMVITSNQNREDSNDDDFIDVA